MNLMQRLSPICLIVALMGCQDPTVAPQVNEGRARPVRDVNPDVGCPLTATVTVTDEASLRAAILAARPGDVIAVRGTIAIATDDTILTPDITITCATIGSGLVATGTNVTDMLTVGASGVIVDRLALDGTLAGDSPFLATNDGIALFAQNIRFTNNTVTCAAFGLCVFIAGGTGAVITDNSFHAGDPLSGIHLQANGPDPSAAFLPIRVDGARVQRNTLVATSPTSFFRFGAIRPFDADDLVITDNTISGAWRNGISAVRMSHSRIRGNQIQGVLEAGIRTSDGNPANPLGEVADNLFVANLVIGSGKAGVFAQLACRNLFVANHLEDNAGDVGVLLDGTTGANVVAGVENAAVIDNGAFDCDGDGDTDPNVITGGARRQEAAPADMASSDPVRRVQGIPVQ